MEFEVVEIEIWGTRTELWRVRIELRGFKSEFWELRIEVWSFKSEFSGVRIEFSGPEYQFDAQNVALNSSLPQECMVFVANPDDFVPPGEPASQSYLRQAPFSPRIIRLIWIIAFDWRPDLGEWKVI